MTEKKSKSREVLLKEEEVVVSRKNQTESEESWISNLEKNVSLKVYKQYKNYLEFDLEGVDTSVANALRRAMIAEVPTMAIETVFVMNNTSVIQDEVLSHRLGLIPIHADPRKFDYLSGEPTDVNTLVFELHSRCSVNPKNPDAKEPENKFINATVPSSALKWIPQGSQAEVFAADPIRPCHDDILVAKLRPGQEIDLEVHCVKGIGKEHAKWSPVSCASYRLLPEIEILEPITGADAHKFQKCFAPGVIEIVKNKKGEEEAKVANARYDTVSRECLRHPEFKDKVVLKRVYDHFIYQVETVGFFAPDQVVVEALKVLSEKCTKLQNAIANL